MWLVLAVGLILMCICAAAASSEDEQAKASALAREQQANEAREALKQRARELDRQRAARRPEALSLVLKEEFPSFRNDFTYSRCQYLLSWFQDAGQVAIEQARAEAPGDADRTLGLLFARTVAPTFSAAYADHALAQPAQTWRTVRMCIESSRVRVEADPVSP